MKARRGRRIGRLLGILDALIPVRVRARQDLDELTRARSFIASVLLGMLLMLPIGLRDILLVGTFTVTGLRHLVLQSALIFGLSWRRTKLPLEAQSSLVLTVGLGIAFSFAIGRPYLIASNPFWVGALLAAAAFFSNLRLCISLFAMNLAFHVYRLLHLSPVDLELLKAFPSASANHFVDAIGSSLLVIIVLTSYRSLHRRLTQETAEKTLMFMNQQAVLQNSARFIALGEFAGAISHQLNNPLAVVAGRAGQARILIENEDVAKLPQIADLRYCLERIDATAVHMARIIESLRRFSRSGDNEPVEEARLAELLDRVVAIAGERLKAEGVRLDLQVPVDLRLVCRPVLLEQVFMNLLSNARQAVTGLQDRWVRVSATQMASARVEVRLEDSGLGIPLNVQSHLFQPFFTTKPADEGTGLGLSLSLGIVRDLGGDIRYDDRSANTCFVVTLPCLPSIQATH